MSPFDVLDKADALREKVTRRPRVSMAELARSKSWRDDLKESGVVEVTDRGETAAWIVSADEMEAPMEAYTLMEEEQERASLAAMFEAREDSAPVSGEKLRQGAEREIWEHLDEWRRIADEHRAE